MWVVTSLVIGHFQPTILTSRVVFGTLEGQGWGRRAQQFEGEKLTRAGRATRVSTFSNLLATQFRRFAQQNPGGIELSMKNAS